MEIAIGVLLGLSISWLFAWIIEPLLIKDKNNIEARFTRIERYLAHADGRLQTLETMTTTQLAHLQGLTEADVMMKARPKRPRLQFLRRRFRQTMGVVFILKPFVPLIALLVIGLFGYLIVNDIRNDPVISQGVNQVTTNIETVQAKIENLSNILNSLKADFTWVEDVVGVISGILNAIAAVINAIITAINVLPGIKIPPLDIDIPGIRNISKSIEELIALSDAIKGLMPDFEPLYLSFKTIVLKWWGYAKWLFILVISWLGLSTLASAYWNISRGLEMIRQQRPLPVMTTANALPQPKKRGLLKSRQ